jgi:hypothetical protein
MPVPSALNGSKSRGATTAAGKRKIALARVTHGIQARLLVLEGIEDAGECERFQEGFRKVWHPVGTHEEQCVAHLAHCYWRLIRAARYESEAITAEMLKETYLEDIEVEQQIKAILGSPSDLDGNGERLAESRDLWDSPHWWRKILSGDEELEISREEAEALFGYVTEKIFHDEDQEEDTATEQEFTIPEGPITLGELRAQLDQLAPLCQPDRPSPLEILQECYDALLREIEDRKKAHAQARRFIARYMLLPADRSSTLANERRQILSESRHHLGVLERLQAVRQHGPIAPPLAVDVNVTGVAPSE